MKTKNWLIAIFVLTIIIRLILAFSTSNFTYDSYFHLRQVDHITQTGLPLFEDSLSYGGRSLQFLPTFHYLMAFLNLFLPLTLIAKIIPNALIASLTIIVFKISETITKNKNASLFSALIAGFLPILYSTSNFTPLSLFLPLIFLSVYSFLNLQKKKHVLLYVISFLILTLTSPASFLIIIGFLIYLLLATLERIKLKKAEIELILFSIFFFLWTQFLFFKGALLKEGINFIWQNIPSQIITQYLPSLSLSKSLVLVSIIPFVAGIFVVYQSLFKLKSKKILLLISLAISTTILAWLQLVNIIFSLSFFGITLAILFATFYEWMEKELIKFKHPQLKKNVGIILLILLLPTMLIPAIAYNQEQKIPTDEEIKAFEWINENVPTDAAIVSLLEEGHLVTYIAKRKNFMDNEFNNIEDTQERFTDLNALYVTPFETQALNILDKYELTYLIFTPQAQERYNISDFRYRSARCFKRIYEEKTKIYRVKCEVQRK